MRRTLRGLSSVLIVSGVLLLADAAVTYLWQEPVSALLAWFDQDRLDGELAAAEDQGLGQAELTALASLDDATSRIRFLARLHRRRLEPGDPLGRVRIPRIDLRTVAVEGTDPEELREGPGHYPRTPIPGLRGTVGIAGHRTTYLAPFRRLDRLRRGDAIEVEMPYGRFTYRVEARKIVPPSATYVVRKVKHDRLVLTACHPLYSAAQRIVVFARLTQVTPRGLALSARPS